MQWIEKIRPAADFINKQHFFFLDPELQIESRKKSHLKSWRTPSWQLLVEQEQPPNRKLQYSKSFFYSPTLIRFVSSFCGGGGEASNAQLLVGQWCKNLKRLSPGVLATFDAENLKFRTRWRKNISNKVVSQLISKSNCFYAQLTFLFEELERLRGFHLTFAVFFRS